MLNVLYIVRIPCLKIDVVARLSSLLQFDLVRSEFFACHFFSSPLHIHVHRFGSVTQIELLVVVVAFLLILIVYRYYI